MKERLHGADYRFIAICAALFAAATWYSAGNFHRAFPEASIEFRVSRDDGRALAERFLAGQNYSLAGYRDAASFSYDDDAKTFLEREGGFNRTNDIQLWRWSYRWFRPQQKEEYRAEITPTGKLAGFSHEIPEDASRPAAAPDQARAAAENFLRTRTRFDPAGLEFLEASETARPHRIDRVFTWKDPRFALHDATLRVELTVLGDEVGEFRQYLKIPDQWTRDYQRLRSKNQLASTIDTAVMLALVVGLIVVIVMRVRRQDVRWRAAAIVGCIGMVLAFCSQLNEFPLQEFGYPTTDSYSSFVARQILNAVIAALGAGGLLFVLTAGAEPLYRQSFGGQVALGNLFSFRGLRTKRFLLGAILGITLTAIFVAYQTGFYITAYKFGAWSPVDVPYSDLLNTRFPWLFILFGGFFPAVSEEFLFRLFAIPFLKKLVRWMPAALGLAGFIWGFGHAGYPQQPFFIRGLEVGIGGVALGVVMLRWGILPTLVWHYSVDAMYSAMLLVRSPNLYLKLSGAASAGIIVLPVIAALVAYWRKGGFEPHEGLLNRDQAPPAEIFPEVAAAPSPADDAYRPLSPRLRIAFVAVLVIGLCTLLVPTAKLGNHPTYRVPADQARAASDAFLRAQGLDPNSFRHITFPDSPWNQGDRLAAKYFLEHRSLDFTARMFEQNHPLQRWVTRYFRPSQKEEFLVAVHPETGRVRGFIHTFPEDAPGADLSATDAIQVATRYAASRGIDLTAMDLKETDSEKQKARRDYTLTWEARRGDPRNVDEAHYRAIVTLAGDRIASLGSTWKLPETWERDRTSRNFLSILVLTLRIVVVAVIIVRGIWMMLGQIRRGAVRWGTVLRIAVPATVLLALSALLSRSLMLQNYRTEIPFETFQAVTYTTVAMTVIAGFLMFAAAAALLTSFFPGCTAALRAAGRRVLAIDALFATAAAIGLGVGLGQVLAILSNRLHAQALPAVDAPDLIVSALPVASAIADAVRTVIVGAAGLAVVVLVVQTLRYRWMRMPVALIGAFVLLPVDVHTPGEFALQYAFALVCVACAALFCVRIPRGNYLAYALVLWTLAFRGPLADLLGSGNPALATQGWIVAAVLLLSIIWTIAPAFARKPEAAVAAAP